MLLKWLISVLIVVALMGGLQPLLNRYLRLGRLPGDVSFQHRGRTWQLPFTSTILLSLLAWFILRLI